MMDMMERTNKRVLVVAHDRELRDMLSIQLISAGYTVYGAENGLEALEQMEKHPVDLVLTDYQMPWMDGIEFLSLSRLRWPGTPVVILSGKQGDLAHEQAVEEGAFAWVRKGCESMTLLEVVAMVIPHSAHV